MGEIIMNCYEFGLCKFGYYYGDNYKKIRCVNCEVIDKVINEICNAEDRLVFRALSDIEKKSLDTYNTNLHRGNFEEIILEEDSYQGVINKIFEYVRVTLNDKKIKEKQFSYSRCFVVPLFKYTNKEENPVIAMKNLKLNTFDISYDCTYYQWIKGYYTRDDEHTYITEDEENIAIKELFSSNIKVDSISDYLKYYYKKRKHLPYESCIREFTENMKVRYDNKLSLCDLDDISNIKIQSFTLDLSMFNRKSINNYLQYCSNEQVKIKRVASFNNDREIISTEPFNSYRGEFHIIQDKSLINNFKLITICVLFLEKNRNEIDKKIIDIIESYISKIRNEYIQYIDRAKVDLLIEHLKKNYEEEFQALKNIKGLFRDYNEGVLSWFERSIDICCEKNSISKKLISQLRIEMI